MVDCVEALHPHADAEHEHDGELRDDHGHGEPAPAQPQQPDHLRAEQRQALGETGVGDAADPAPDPRHDTVAPRAEPGGERGAAQDAREQHDRDRHEHDEPEGDPLHPGRRPALEHHDDEPDGQQDVLGQLRPGARDEHLGRGVAEGEPPRPQHRVVEAGRDGAALRHGVRQGGPRGVGDRGLADLSARAGSRRSAASWWRGSPRPARPTRPPSATVMSATAEVQSPVCRLVSRYQTARTTTP